MREICKSGSMRGMWKRGYGWLLRHRQTKGTATAMQNLLLPRHIPTLPEAVLPLPTKRNLHPRPDRRKEPRPTAGHKQVAKQFADGK